MQKQLENEMESKGFQGCTGCQIAQWAQCRVPFINMDPKVPLLSSPSDFAEPISAGRHAMLLPSSNRSRYLDLPKTLHRAQISRTRTYADPF